MTIADETRPGDWPRGDGEMASYIRRHDWSATPLGPIGDWPEALKVSVDIMLGNASTIAIYWGPDLVLLYNDRWRTLIGDRHPRALGQPARQILPEIWADIAPLFARVMRGEGSVEVADHTLPLLRDAQCQERRFDHSFGPIPLADGSVGGAFTMAVETTQHLLVQRASADARRRLRASEGRYRTLIEAIDEGFCVNEFRFDPASGHADYRILEANPAFYEQTGLPRSVLKRWLRKETPDLEEHWYEIYGHVAKTGEPIRLEQRSDALGRWFDVHAYRIDAPESHRIAVLFKDISARKRHEEQVQLLLRELNHRAKNLLGLVQAIARQTASSGLDDFLERFAERVQGLSAAQDLLVRSSWKAVPVADLVESQIAHFSHLIGARIEISGPSVSVAPDLVQTLGMAIHELATNASKYGALSNDAGQVIIRWSIDPPEDPEAPFAMSWVERGGPTVVAPTRSGFGSTVTTRMVELATNGTVQVDYEPAGLVWRLSCPGGNLLASVTRGGAGVRRLPEITPVGAPRRRSVLVVEDDPLMASDIAALLTAAGFSVLGPAGSVDDALFLLERSTCETAVIDVNLGRETSEPIARELIRTGIPFVVLSGYSRDQLPDVFRGAPLAGKPLRVGELETLLERAKDAATGQ